MTRAIVFGVLLNDVGENWPGRNQLLVALSAHVPVVLLEQRHDRKSIVPLRPEEIGEHLYVIRNAFPWRSSRYGHTFEPPAILDGMLIRRRLHSAGLTPSLLWLTAVDPLMAKGVPREYLLYDCADPNFTPDSQSSFDKAEAEIAGRAAITFSSAHQLHRKLQAYNANSYLLPNATSDDFHPARTKGLPPAPLPPGPGRAVVGYLGTIDSRFDATSVLAAARDLPECTFAIVGRVNHDQRAAVAELRACRNVVMPGQVGYDEGRAWVASFTIGMIPFKPGPINDAINPVKMYMYLMAGLPIVATDIEECRRNDFVSVADSPRSFAEAVRTLATSEHVTDREERMAFALRNTWGDRAQEALELLSRRGIMFDRLQGGGS
jgi:glycosyltransferase involved in cell wall biosynthesis